MTHAGFLLSCTERLNVINGIARIWSREPRWTHGAASLGLESWPDVEVDLEHPSLTGVEPANLHAALVFGCGADVFV